MKKLVLTIAVAAIAVGAYAQPIDGFDQNNGTFERVTKRGPYLTNRFFDNWFIGVGGGVNYYVGTNDKEAKFGDRMGLAIDASIGKWITPTVGLRLQYAGVKAKGAANPMDLYATTEAIGNSGYVKEEFNVMNIHADLLWNLSNAVSGYRNDRFWDIVPYVGFGFARSYDDNNHVNRFAPTVGILNNFRLGGVVDLTLEARSLIVQNDFDGVRGKTKLEAMPSLTAGLTFKLGPKGGFKRPVYQAPPDYTPFEQRIRALEGDVNTRNRTIDELNRELNSLRNRPAPEPVVKFTPTTLTSFFSIGSATISEKDMINLGAIANTMKVHTDRKFTIIGYADSSTGSSRRNQELSQKRAEAVANALVDKFGVNRSQLVIESRGGVKNHTNPSLDRAVRIE